MEKEKKSFETPEVKVFQYEDQDIITASGCDEDSIDTCTYGLR